MLDNRVAAKTICQYFKKFDTYIINRPDDALLSIKGEDGGQTQTLQDALIAIGMSDDEAKRALPVILRAPFLQQ